LGLPQILVMISKKISFANPERFFMVSGFHLPNLLIPLFCIIVFAVLWKLRLKETFLMTKTNYFLAVMLFALAALILSNINILISFPQPHHYNIYLSIFGSIIVFTVLYYWLKDKKCFKYIYNIFAVCIGLLLLANTFYDLSIDHSYSKAEEMQQILNAIEGEAVILTNDLELQYLISSKTDAYMYIPNTLYSTASFNETLERLWVAEEVCENIDMTDEWNKYIFHGSDYTDCYKGGDFEPVERLMINTPIDKYRFDLAICK